MRNRFAIIFMLLFDSSAGAELQETQEISLEDLIKAGNKKASEVARSEDSGRKIPGYSKERALAKGEEFNTKTDANLKSEAEQQIINVRTNDKSSSGTTITLKAGERTLSDLEGMAKHEMFSKAKEIYADPLKSFNGITKEECSRILESQKLHKRHKVKEQKKTIEYEEKNCEVANSGIACEKFLEVTCEATEGTCDRGGIELDSVESGLEFKYNYPILTIGTEKDNKWTPGKGCDEKNFKFKFNIKGKDLIKEFKITKLRFDDYVWIKVNEHNVYIGPIKGSTSIKRITEQRRTFAIWPFKSSLYNVYFVTTTGSDKRSCELNTDWERDLINNKTNGYNLNKVNPDYFTILQEKLNPIRDEDINIDLKDVKLDLKDYLKEGKNTIWIRVIASGTGEFWMDISAPQYCCSKFKEQWRKRCYPN